MSKRSERRDAERADRKLAYQQLRQNPPQQPQPAEAAATPEPDLLNKARAASARNATKHGCCAVGTLILKSESIEDYKAFESTWFQAYKPKSEAEKHLVQELVNADWFHSVPTAPSPKSKPSSWTKLRIPWTGPTSSTKNSAASCATRPPVPTPATASAER